MAPFLFFLFGAGFCFHFLCSQPPRSWGSVQWSRPFVWDERRDDRYQSPQMPPRVPVAPTCSAGPGPALNVGGQSSLCPLGEKAKRNPRPASQGSAARSEGVCGSAPHLTQRPSLFPGERRFWSTQSPGSEATLGCACVGVKAAIASGSLATRAGADLSSAREVPLFPSPPPRGRITTRWVDILRKSCSAVRPPPQVTSLFPGCWMTARPPCTIKMEPSRQQRRGAVQAAYLPSELISP